jgi:hypothetical protein
MSFGDDDNPRPTPPPLPDPLPSPPQFATGAGKLQPKGKPYGGTLLTSPMGGGTSPTIQRSLVTL